MSLEEQRIVIYTRLKNTALYRGAQCVVLYKAQGTRVIIYMRLKKHNVLSFI